MSSTNAGESAASDGRDARWRDHRAERQERILAAATAAIEENGGTTPVSAIADEAGVPRSVVYRLFADREDLDEQIRNRILGDLMGQLAPALDPAGTIADSIRIATETYVGWVVDHDRLHQFLGTGSAARRTTGSRAVTGTRTAIALHLVQVLDGHLDRLVGPGHAPVGMTENLAFGLVGLVDGTVNRWVAHPETRSTPEDLIDFLSDTLWTTIAAAAARAGLTIDPDDPVRRP